MCTARPAASQVRADLLKRAAARSFRGSRPPRISLPHAAMAWAPNWEERLAWVARNGLPVIFTEARVEDNGFFALYLRPDEALLPRSDVSRLHISLGYSCDYPTGVAEVLCEAINAAWADRFHVLDIEWFGKGGAAMVRGSDPVSQDVVIQVAHRCGHYGNGVHVKPRQLHVSL